MEKHVSLTLDDGLSAFVDAQMSTGRCQAVGEVLTAGLRLSEREAAERIALRAALVEGESSGSSTPIDLDAFIAERLVAE